MTEQTKGSTLVQDVVQVIKTHAKCIFLGSDMFFMEDPFNEDRDIVVGLQYKLKQE